MNITAYIQTWWPLTSNNIPLWKRKSFNRVQEIVELLLLQKLSEYRQLTSKFLRNDRSGKANSSWIYTALLNLQLHTPAHTQALALQQSPWPLRGCGDTWKYFDPWMIEKYLETLRQKKYLKILGYLDREEEEKSISGMSLVFEPSSCLDNVAIGVQRWVGV